ncbi:MAG: hypothetical protein A2V99_08850 [Spirochaetes bacterium RBG_16_67_19]|nr:MAG: hypothetical protein A2V99_08850 [Spirochaetes bacterium RBG_16_67_19]
MLLFAILACILGWAQFIASALGAKIAPENLPLGPPVAAVITAVILALAAPALIIAASVLANHAFGAPLPTAAQLSGWTAIPVNFAVMLLLVGIGEEAGWTAFAAPRLLKGGSLLAAWGLLAGIRVLWHLPLMLNGSLPWVLGVGGNIAGCMYAPVGPGSWPPSGTRRSTRWAASSSSRWCKGRTRHVSGC